jgi:hypothetical protein
MKNPNTNAQVQSVTFTRGNRALIVPAEYQKEGLPRHMVGNPLIEALGPVSSLSCVFRRT